jgi:uncharacterized protein (TIGR02569 family)
VTSAALGAPPPSVVCDAFGVEGIPARLPGGEDNSWRCGSAVLKRVDDAEQFSWIATVLSQLTTPTSIVVPQPIRTGTGAWVADGWIGIEYVDARPHARSWHEIIAAGRTFHECLAPLERPAWMDNADDWWRRGDAVAWDDRAPSGPAPYRALVERLRGLRRPVNLASQVVHGDLCGNVLFDDSGRAVIIDFSPYWRPVEWASAVVAVDAYEWEDAGPIALTWVDDVDPARQLLVRAAIYRIATSAEVALVHGFDDRQYTVHAATVDALADLVD